MKILLGQPERRRALSRMKKLCVPVTLRDGNRLLAFSRCNHHPAGLWGRATRHTARYSLDSPVLADLVEQEGYLVVYMHFGQPQPRLPELFPGPDRLALGQLAEQYRQGLIWVAPTLRLLNYWVSNHHLAWHATESGDSCIIDLDAINDPIGAPRLPEAEELAGICFYTPRPADTVIRVNGRILPAKIYPPDHTGRQSVGFDPLPPPSLDPLAILEHG